MLHVNAAGGEDSGEGEHAIFFGFNPTAQRLSTNVTLPLYYAGLEESVTLIASGTSGDNSNGNHGQAIANAGIGTTQFFVARDYTITVPVNIPAEGYAWFVFKGI